MNPFGNARSMWTVSPGLSPNSGRNFVSKSDSTTSTSLDQSWFFKHLNEDTWKYFRTWTWTQKRLNTPENQDRFQFVFHQFYNLHKHFCLSNSLLKNKISNSYQKTKKHIDLGCVEFFGCTCFCFNLWQSHLIGNQTR